MMRFDKANEHYHHWLAERLPLIDADVRRKHAVMGEAPFPFLRATFFRWAQVWPELCPEAQTAPIVLAVGDLHVENFGTWRDFDGRLIWGINDFDEAEWMPYTCDLVRLAVSARLAIEAGHLSVLHLRASKSILEGYLAGLRAGGRPFVLAEDHPILRHMAVERLKDPQPFWGKLQALPEIKSMPPASAMKGLRKSLPVRDLKMRLSHRIAGLGSLGRQRYLALADFEGGLIAREAKQLTDSAWLWAWPPQKKSRKPRIHYQEIMDRSIRCQDPFVRLREEWIVRRLAPDCSRIELASLPATHDGVRLLRAMGWETANVHLGTCDADTLLADLDSRDVEWLHNATNVMVESVQKDWKTWKSRKSSPPRA
jgi:uncharacterized protein (DUF2252 family)